MRRCTRLGMAGMLASIFFGAPALAATPETSADPDQLRIRPILEARVRYENVDHGALDAEGVTIRVRGGAEATLGHFSLLAEGEAAFAPVNDYNAFPFSLPGEEQSRPQHAVIADPENLELNRFQLQFRKGKSTLTAGRQRINLDDQRWVGSVGWRQNEQTFDAVRGETMLGPVGLDLTYAISQRTIFGTDAGPRTDVEGDFVFAGASSKIGPIQGKLFAYLLDFDEPFALANNSQTYGGFLSGAIPLGAGTKLSLRASYGRQSDYGDNPFDYAADYWSFEGSTALAGFNVTAGWEKLGSDNGRGLQTPLATLHKFNGWADLFLTTPPTGLEDAYVSIARKFDGVKFLPGLNANVVFHQFDSAVGNAEYGTEWDASVGFKIRKVGVLLKYADYDAKDFGIDTRKLWLQAEWAF